MDYIKNTLETQWGENQQRGAFYYGLSRGFTAAENQKFPQQVSSLGKKIAQQTLPAFSTPLFQP
jgi:hypothetical protein